MAEPARLDRRVLVVASLPIIVLSLDFSGVVVALPTIATDLGLSTRQSGWVLNAFLLASAGPLVAAGRAADHFGRRRVLQLGLVGFIVGTLTCAVAPSAGVLILGRSIQGVAAAVNVAAGLALLSADQPMAVRARAIGAWGAIGGVASAIGPLVGGLTVSLWSWRAFFLVTVPFLAVALVTSRGVAESRDPRPGQVGWTAAALLTVGITGVVGAVQLRADAADRPEAGSWAVVGLVCLFAFVRVDRRGRPPLLPWHVLRSRPLAAAVTTTTTANIAFAAINVALTVWLQNTYGLSALQTGIAFLASTVPFAILGFASARILTRTGPRLALAGSLVVSAAGAAVLTTIDTGGLSRALVGLAVSGVGQGVAYSLSGTVAMGSLDDGRAGLASGVLNTLRSMGMVTGVAMATTTSTAFAANVARPLGSAALVTVIGAVAVAWLLRRTTPVASGVEDPR